MSASAVGGWQHTTSCASSALTQPSLGSISMAIIVVTYCAQSHCTRAKMRPRLCAGCQLAIPIESHTSLVLAERATPHHPLPTSLTLARGRSNASSRRSPTRLWSLVRLSAWLHPAAMPMLCCRTAPLQWHACTARESGQTPQCRGSNKMRSAMHATSTATHAQCGCSSLSSVL